MGDPLLIAVVALGLSLGVSAIRFVDWFIHSEPKAVVQTARYAAIGIALLSLGLLVVLLFNQQWTAAAGLASVLLLVLAWYGPRLLRPAFKLADLAPDPSERTPARADGAFGNRIMADPELVRRAAAVLEDYLRQVGSGVDLQTVGNGRANGGASGNSRDADFGADTMSEKEAFEILGLKHGAQEAEICEAHRRLVQMIHPDRGGSHYLTVKINQAKATLLHDADRAVPARRKSGRRRAPRRDHA